MLPRNDMATVHHWRMTVLSLFVRVLAAAALLITLTNPTRANDVRSAVLPNGMKVIVREGHTINLAALDIWIKAGSIYESESTSGATHFIEHLIFKGTPKYGPGRIDREIERFGAQINGGTSRDYIHLYTTVPSEHVPMALDLLADAIMNAQFRAEDIETERRIILDEIARSESDPVQRALTLFARTAYVTHPYRLSPMGSRESIARLTRDDLVAFYRRHFVPANTSVAIAGDVDFSAVVRMVEQAFSGFGNDVKQDQSSLPPAEPPLSAKRVSYHRSFTNQSYVVLGYHAAPASDLTAVCALDVILALLGDEFHGRLATALNAKGIRFGTIKVDYTTQRQPSTFAVLLSVRPEDVDRAIEVILAEYRRLADEVVPADELAHAKRVVEGSDLFEQETFSGQARALGLYESVASYDHALKYGSTVREITSADVQSVATRYFTGDRYCAVVIAPEAAR